MKWFRRNLDDFGDKEWVFSNNTYLPRIKVPEPWRDHPKADELYLVPVSFVKIFLENAHVVQIRHQAATKVAELRDSIRLEGLQQPCTMVYDATGKLRYHDGHHRLTAILEIPEITHIPVFLKETKKVKGYGRPISEEVVALFQFLDKK